MFREYYSIILQVAIIAFFFLIEAFLYTAFFEHFHAKIFVYTGIDRRNLMKDPH